MDEALMELAKQTPAIAILLSWVYTERKAHRETFAFFTQQLADCHAVMANALSRHIDNEQVK